MRVDIERVLAIKAELRAINDQPLDSLQFFKDGVEIKPNPKALEMWNCIGLSNTDFISNEVYSEDDGPEEKVWK